MGFMDNYGKWLSKIYNIIYMNPMGKKHNSRDSNAVWSKVWVMDAWMKEIDEISF